MLEIEISTGFKLLLTAFGGILSLHRISSIIVVNRVKGIDELRKAFHEHVGACNERGKRCNYGRPEETEDNK